MLRFVPLALAFVAVVGVAVYDGMLNHRWMPNVEAEQCALLLDLVPDKIGPWRGESYETSDEILRTAGAEGHVSRLYKNEETGDYVKIWLIVGPFKHVIRHTPDICYPAQDFRRFEKKIGSYNFDLPDGQGDNQFNTAAFVRAGQSERVFWSWHKPDDTGKVNWFASPNMRVNRETYPGTPALFKLYFTTGADPEEPLEDNPSNEFAEVFLPMLNQMILARENPEAAGAAAEVYAEKVGLDASAPGDGAES